MLNARIRKAWLASRLPIGVIGDRADLSYGYHYLGAGGETLSQMSAGTHQFAKALADAKRPLIIVGQGAITRADGHSVLGHAAKTAVACGAVSDDWNGFSVLHTAAAPCRRARPLLPAARRRRPRHARYPGGREVRRDRDGLSARRRRDRHERPRQCLRRLSGHSWRCRRAPRRRDPAGCDLHGEIRALRQHGRAAATRPQGGVPAGRCARGLDDYTRACRRWPGTRCPTTRWTSCARHSMPNARTWRCATRSSRPMPPSLASLPGRPDSSTVPPSTVRSATSI